VSTFCIFAILPVVRYEQPSRLSQTLLPLLKPPFNERFRPEAHECIN